MLQGENQLIGYNAYLQNGKFNYDIINTLAPNEIERLVMKPERGLTASYRQLDTLTRPNLLHARICLWQLHKWNPEYI